MATERGRRAKERKRSRIVVNVDDVRERKREEEDRTSRLPLRRRLSKRGRRRLLFAASLFAALVGASVVGAYLWYQTNEKSPTYSLALLVDAARRNDRQTVDALVDVDAVTRSLVPQVVAKVSGQGQTPQQGAQPNAQQNALSQAPASVRRYVEANAGVLIPGARDAVRDALIAEIKQGAAAHVGDYPFFVTAIGARLAADAINVEGDVARVAYKSNGQPVILSLQRSGAGDRWRVVGVESEELATRIADNLSRGLPALGR